MASRADPQRTCVGCGDMGSRSGFLRLCRTPTGVMVDPKARASGRGAWVHRKGSCVRDMFRTGRLARSLRVSLASDEAARLGADIEKELNEG